MDPIYVPANIYDFILHAKLFESTVHNIFIGGLFLAFYAWLNRLTSIDLCFCYKTTYNTFRA